MQKVNVWKVLLLSVVTLGLYWFYWVVTRRDEMVQAYRQTIPHWGWMVAPPLLVIIFSIPLMFFGIAGGVNTYDLTMWLMAYMVLGLTVAYAISVWWMWRFAQATERVTNGRMTTGWTIALYIFIGLFVIPFLQYYFNRAKSSKAFTDKTMLAPTLKFKVTALASIVAMTLALTPLAFIDWGTVQPTRADSETQGMFAKTERLYAQYQDCINKLGVEYPDVTPETEAAYNDAQAHCESIRIEQNKAVDEYNKMTGH